jgi:hypothetical protein
MKELFTVIPRSVLADMAKRGLSGVDCMVLIALAHCRVGDEIGVTSGGYVMSAKDVSEYLDGALPPDHVRKSLSRMVSKGMLVRSRRVKRCGSWMSVYAIARSDDGSPASEATCEARDKMDQPVYTGTRNECKTVHGTSVKRYTDGVYTGTHTSISTQETLNRDMKIESLSRKSDSSKPRYEYPTDECDVYEQMLSDGIEPNVCDAMDVAQKFFDYNDARDWMVDGRPMYDWHAALGGFVRRMDGASYPLTG